MQTNIRIRSPRFTPSPSGYTYDGKAKEPAVTVRLGGATLRAGTDYAVSYSNNTKVGTATATVTGKGNYTGTAKATFSIAASRVTVYRVERHDRGPLQHHHYTISRDERDVCVGSWGWNDEGTGWYALAAQ